MPEQSLPVLLENNSTLTLSVVLISYNAAHTLNECLESVNFANEILIVDNFSTDQTLLIAEKFAAKVISHQWQGFGLQKRFAVNSAQNDWVLCLDCDEIVSNHLREQIIKTLANPQAVGYYLPRCNQFLGKYLRHGEAYPDYCLRLFNRQYGNWSADSVHEKVQLQGKCDKLSGDLLHHSMYSISSYLHKQNRYSDLAAEKEILAGKKARISQLILSPIFRFIKFYLLRQGWRDGWQGLIHILIGCFNSFCKYAKMLEQQNNHILNK